MRLKTILFGVAIVAVSFVVSLQTMNWLWPVAIDKLVLAPLPPLPSITRSSQIVAPIAVSMSAIGEALDRAAPRDMSGKADTPAAQILSNADINWAIARGPISVSGTQNTLALSTPLNGKLSVLGSLSTNANSALGNALGNVLGGNVAKQIGNINIKSLNANAAIRGNVAVTSQPELTSAWRIDPKLSAQVILDDSSLTVAGAKVAVPTQVKPVIDKTVNEQLAALQQRLRNDRTLETLARREWAKACRSLALPAAAQGLPPLWLEMRPVQAVAAQPAVDARAVTLTMGIQAETRIVANQTTPDCPFPASLDIVNADTSGVNIALPIDLPFTSVSQIIEAQLKGRTFPEDGSGPADVTVKTVSVAATGDRLLISLLVDVREKKSVFGLGADATIHVWGRPVLDPQDQILRLTDLQLAVESDAAFGLLGAAARTVVPHLQHALAQRATIDLKPFAINAQQRVASLISDFRKNDDGVRVETSLSSIRLTDIAFDSDTLRIVAEASGAISVAVTSLPNL
jgi:hypothetical protein